MNWPRLPAELIWSAELLEAAEAAGVRVLLAPSLPGRMSPKASGELIQEAVYHMLREE